MDQIEVPERQGIYLFLLPNLKCGYVGSSNNLKRRYEQHVSGIGNKTIERYLKHSSNIEYMILEFCDGYKTKDLKMIEEFWIDHFRKKGLNLINVSRPTKEPNHNEPKAVLAYNKDTLEFIGRWPSLTEASKAVNENVANISASLLKRLNKNSKTPRLTAKKMFWFFEDSFSIEALIKQKEEYDLNLKTAKQLRRVGLVRSVTQLTKENIYIKTWSSISDAGKFLNIQVPNIVDACKGKKFSAGGYLWKYAEERELENENLRLQNF